MLVGMLGYSFHLYSPLAYGMDWGPEGYARMENTTHHHLQLLDTWDF